VSCFSFEFILGKQADGLVSDGHLMPNPKPNLNLSSRSVATSAHPPICFLPSSQLYLWGPISKKREKKWREKKGG